MTTHRNTRMIAAIAVAAAIELLLILTTPVLPTPIGASLRIALSVPLVLLAPGYCITIILFPHHEDLDRPTRIGLSLAISLAFPLVTIIVINTHVGTLQPYTIGQTSSIATLVLCVAATLRRGFAAPSPPHTTPLRVPMPRSWWFFGIVIMVLTSGIVIGAIVTLSLARTATTTQFFITTADGVAHYPTQCNVGDELHVMAHIVHAEPYPQRYTLVIWVTDTYRTRREMVAHYDVRRVRPQEERLQPITWRMPWRGARQQVTFALLLPDTLQPYRELTLWVDVENTGG